MPAKMPEPKAPSIPVRKGELQITLDGKPRTLRATLRAAQMVNDGFGGFRAALEGVTRFDMNTFSVVIGAGLNTKTQEDLNKVAEQVYATGLAELSGPVTKFISMLMNGGRDPAEKTDPKDKGGAEVEGNGD